MRSIEEIDRRLEEVKQAPESLETSIAIDYLKIAKDDGSEAWLKHLVNKYSFEIREDKAIVDTLKWVLEEDTNEV